MYDVDSCINRIREAKKNKESTSIAYLGNIVNIWERLATLANETGEVLIELGSDQTSCHNPFNGGYYPVQLSFQDANTMMVDDPAQFKYFPPPPLFPFPSSLLLSPLPSFPPSLLLPSEKWIYIYVQVWIYRYTNVWTTGN